MNGKQIFIFIYIILFAFITSAAVLLFINGRRNNIKAAEVKTELNKATETIARLNKSIEDANKEIQNLSDLHNKDRKTISEFKETIRKTGSLIIWQRNIISELTTGNEQLGRGSSAITEGLGQSIEEIDGIIEFIKNRKN